MRIELRNNKVLLDGYVNAVKRYSKPLLSPQGLFVEQINEGVFQRALDRADDVKLLFNHKHDRELGSIKSGNLQLFEDSIGLRAICEVADGEVIEKAKNGDLKGWSFGFYANKDTWQDGEPYQKRTIEDMDLIEVSILDMTPAYNATTIEARADEHVLTETRGETFKAVIDDCEEVPEAKEEHEEVRAVNNSKYRNLILKAKTF